MRVACALGRCAGASTARHSTQRPRTSTADLHVPSSVPAPDRSPSPFVGNGRLGVVIPALGIGASDSFLAGLVRARRRTTCPASSAIPAWNAIGVFDGERWLDSNPARIARYAPTGRSSTCGPGRRARATTGLDGDRSHLGARRNLRLPRRPSPRRASAGADPAARRADAGSLRDRRAGLLPAELPLARLERSDPGLEAGGHLVSWPHARPLPRSRRERARRALISVSLHSGGAQDDPRPGGGVSWDADLPRAEVRSRASGDTALVEIVLRRASRPHLSLRRRSVSAIASRESPYPLRTSGPGSGPGPRARLRRPCRRQRAGLGPPLGERHRDRRRPRAPAGRPLHALLSPLQRGLGHQARHPAHGTLQRRLLRAHLLGLRHLDVPSAPPHPSRCRPLAGGLSWTNACGGPRERAGERVPWRDVSLGGRRAGRETTPRFAIQNAQLRDPRDRRRRAGPMAVLPRHRRLHLAGAGRVSGHPGNRRLLDQPQRSATPPTTAITSRTWCRWQRG